MANIELLSLIADLNMSESKSRQALGAEIKRLTTAETERIAKLEAAVSALVEALERRLAAELATANSLTQTAKFSDRDTAELLELKAGALVNSIEYFEARALLARLSPETEQS